MLLHHLTWQEVERYLERSTGIIIPIGSTEQHGPNGMVGTDCICPETIARQAGEEADLLVGPTFNVGCAQHHMAFAGTMTLRPSTMIAAMTNWVNSLSVHGFTHMFFINGHGGNVSTIEAAFAEIYAQETIVPRSGQARTVTLTNRNWWELEGITKLCTDLYPNGHGMHATPSEVAITYYAHPKHQKQVEMSPRIAPVGPIRHAHDYRKRFPDGRIGSDPSLANAQDGKRLVDASVQALIKAYEKFLAS